MVAREQHLGHVQAAKLTPGMSRETASTITIAATSPPEST
jgi:undecaprenyl pyrophosphate phosphatase UppP